MKLFANIIFLILICALIGLFVLKKPDGQAWLSMDELSFDTETFPSQLNSIKDKVSVVYNALSSKENSEVKIYRWKDDSGNWVYSDKVADAREAEEVLLDPSGIVILPTNNESIIHLSSFKGLPAGLSQNPVITSASKVSTLFKEANNVQKVICIFKK
jgi:hypothetical protein